MTEPRPGLGRSRRRHRHVPHPTRRTCNRGRPSRRQRQPRSEPVNNTIRDNGTGRDHRTGTASDAHRSRHRSNSACRLVVASPTILCNHGFTSKVSVWLAGWSGCCWRIGCPESRRDRWPLAQAAPYGCRAGAGRVGGVARRRGRLEQFEWLADEVLEAGGEASVWLGRLGSASQERALAARMAEAVAADYEAVIAEAEASEGEAEVVRRRAVAGCGGSCSGSAGGTSSATATRSGLHRGRPAGFIGGRVVRWRPGGGMWIGRRAWLVQRFVDPSAEFVFVDDADEVEADATPSTRGVELSHHGGDCTFETMLRRFGLDDPCCGMLPGSCTRPTWPMTVRRPRGGRAGRDLPGPVDDPRRPRVLR